jgi:hypothetical protein
MTKESENAHEIISKAMEDAGIVDGFYGGVLISGYDLYSVRVGSQRIEESNSQRYTMLIGIIERLKMEMAYDKCKVDEPKELQ